MAIFDFFSLTAPRSHRSEASKNVKHVPVTSLTETPEHVVILSMQAVQLTVIAVALELFVVLSTQAVEHIVRLSTTEEYLATLAFEHVVIIHTCCDCSCT